MRDVDIPRHAIEYTVWPTLGFPSPQYVDVRGFWESLSGYAQVYVEYETEGRFRETEAFEQAAESIRKDISEKAYQVVKGLAHLK